jgi:hypothetical protein
MNDARDKQIADAVINARQHDREDLAIDHAAYIVGQYRLEIESSIRAEALKDAGERAKKMNLWNTFPKLPRLEAGHCNISVNFYDKYGSVYQGYYMEEDTLFYWYSYEYSAFIQDVRGWMYLPEAPAEEVKE